MRSTLASLQLAVTVMLAIVPFLSATPTSFQLSRRAQPPAIVQAVGVYQFVGIFKGPSDQSLQFGIDGLTVEKCVAQCKQAGNTVAGLADACFCAADGVLNNKPTTDSSTLDPCPGNAAEACGATNDGQVALLAYKNFG